jgi:hypothetical protein
MWPFKRTSKSSKGASSRLSGEALELVLEQCDFELASREIADFLKMASAEAERAGGNLAYKTEFVQGWHAFSANPTAHTARAWLRAAPDYEKVICSYLIECCPGGRFAFYAVKGL